MGTFINTQTTDMINSLVGGVKERLKNPYYMNNSKAPTITDYFHINENMSTLDEGLKIAESYTGDNSPIKYDLIKDFYLYGGFEQIQLQLDNGEFGVVADQITSTTYILPNTIVPNAGDLFKIKYLDKSYLFRVVSVDYDTLEFGSNMYKIDFEFYKDNDSYIKDLIVDEYIMVCINDNTKFASIIKKVEYDYVKILDSLTVKLKDYYIDLFYKHRVESLIFKEYGENFYDPVLMEFIIRNEILSYGYDKYIYITHSLVQPYGFNLEYDRSFFNHIETKNKDIKSPRFGFGEIITQTQSLLSMMKEEYFYMKYCNNKNDSAQLTMELFNADLFDRIKSGDLYFKESKSIPDYRITNRYKCNISIISDKISITYKGGINIIPVITDSEKVIYDIIIKYFNNIELAQSDIEFIKNYEYTNSKFLYYYIPILIFILEIEEKRYLKL